MFPDSLGSLAGLVAVGLLFGALGGLTAFLIAYREWSHHFPTRRQALRLALRAAVAAFALLVTLTTFLGALLDHLL